MIKSDARAWLGITGLLIAIAVSGFAHAQNRFEHVAPAIVFVTAKTANVQTGGAVVAAKLDETDTYRFALLKMKGYLSVARALLQMRAPGADYYLKQSVRDVFEKTESEIDRRSAPFTSDILQQLAHAPEGEPVAALATIESAVHAINGSFAQTGAMDTGSVLALSEALLFEAVAHYREAVTDNEVVDLRKYQAGRGFATEAEALVRHSGRLKEKQGHQELLKRVTLIRQAWPGVLPPPIVFDPPSVAGWLEDAIATMDELR